MSFIADFAPILLVLVAIAFIFEFMDATLGVGFGTASTPVLLILGYDVSVIVPSILLTEVIVGIVSIIFHSLFKNVKLGQKRVYRKRPKKKSSVHSIPNNEVTKSASKLHDTTISEPEEHEDEFEEEIIIADEKDINVHDDHELEEIKIENGSFLERIRNLTTDTKVIFVLSTFSILGMIIAAVINVVFEYSETFNLGVKFYIGFMVFIMGVLLLTLRNKQLKLTMTGIIPIGVVAGFNKGISGGGYRPVTVVGQILSGREGRNALASTTFSRTAACVVGIIVYILTHIIQYYRLGEPITWGYLSIAPYLIVGAVLAAPIGAFITKKAENHWIKIAVGWATLILGLFTIIRLILIEVGIWDKIDLGTLGFSLV